VSIAHADEGRQKLHTQDHTIMPLFNVTYETVTPESAENGEAESIGFVEQAVSFREAVRALGGSADCADCWPVSRKNPPRWVTCENYDEDYSTGERESRSLHIPPTVTPSSALRIARVLGVRIR